MSELEDYRTGRCGHNYEITECPFAACASKNALAERDAALAENDALKGELALTRAEKANAHPWTWEKINEVELRAERDAAYAVLERLCDYGAGFLDGELGEAVKEAREVLAKRGK